MLFLIDSLILDMVLDLIHVLIFWFQNFDFGKNVILGVDNSSSTHVDNRKGILVKKIFKSTITMKVTAFCMLML